MNIRKHYPPIVGTCFALFAACAVAQAPATTTGAPSATPAPPAASTPAPARSAHTAKTKTGATAKAQHAKKQHKTMHTAHAKEPNAKREDTEYRTALRRCVEGQTAQRDQCLQNAISRYGRS